MILVGSLLTTAITSSCLPFKLQLQGRFADEATDPSSIVHELFGKQPMSKLEKTGLLAQALRCLTAPVRRDSLTRYLQIVDFMESDPKLMSKKLKPGTPTGDILEGLLTGKDGWTGNRQKSSREYAQVMKRFRALKDMATMSSTPFGPQGDNELGRMCRYCSKSAYDLGKELQVCSRCKNTWYCSRECQVADWKVHKQQCSMYKVKDSQNLIMSFIKKHYFEIMKEVKNKMTQANVQKNDVLLVIDFKKQFRSQRLSPAMEGMFHVSLVRDVLNGSDEPDWFYKEEDTTGYRNNITPFRTGLRDHHGRMTPEHLLVIIRHPDGNSGVYRLAMRSEETGVHLFSEEALSLFADDSPSNMMALRMLLGPSMVPSDLLG